MIKTDKLTPKQELFCQYFASDREFFGNGVQSYIEAFNVDITKKGAYSAARTAASKQLTNGNVTKRINEIFEAHGLNDTFVDKQIEKLIVQDADFSTKLKAIQEYNKLKSRIMDRTEVIHKFEDMDDDELDRQIKARQDRLT